MQQRPSQRRAPSLLLLSSSRRDLGSLRAKLPNLDRSFDSDVPGMEELGDSAVVCPWEAFGDMELSELAQFGVV